MHRSVFASALVTCTLALAGSAFATNITAIDQSAFQAGSGEITFSEVPLGTANPVYAPATYGGGAGAPTVTFGGYFTGQQPGSSNPSACPAGAAITGCVLGNPKGALTIDPNSPQTFTALDVAMPTAPVLSGAPLYEGSIAVKFSVPQTGVGLLGGYFNNVDSTAITAYALDGTLLGSVSNLTTGVDFLGLVTSDGSASIGGIEFSLIGDEPAGFDIDNLQFGAPGQVAIPAQTPEPSSLWLLGTGLLSVPAVLRRRRA